MQLSISFSSSTIVFYFSNWFLLHIDVFVYFFNVFSVYSNTCAHNAETCNQNCLLHLNLHRILTVVQSIDVYLRCCSLEELDRLCSHSVECIFEYRDKRTNNDIWMMVQKTKDWATQTPLKSWSEKNIVLVDEKFILGVYEWEITEDLLLMNLLIYILQWVIWKTRNSIKYNQSIFKESIVLTNF